VALGWTHFRVQRGFAAMAEILLEPDDFLKGMGIWGLRPQRVQGSALALLLLVVGLLGGFA
jgi:hypothetical protein